MIRRLNREAQQQGSVGIQSLARTVMATRLKVQSGQLEASSDTEPAILLNPSADAAELQFLMKAGMHVPGQNFEFERDGNTVLLMQTTVLERGEDFELLRARQMIRETGE